jgi:pimeloyl-ACP methyl ester carboxylesterase
MPLARTILILILLVFAGVVALAYVGYERDIRRARELVSTVSRIAQTACGPIEYAIAGDGPPVLVVHGAGGGFDQGLHFGAPLAAKGFQVIAMSRFGYLRTPLPAEASAAAQADGHVCLLWRRRRPWWKTRAPTRRRASTK